MIFVAEIYYTAQHCSESIMMTNQGGMGIRVANDACGVNVGREEENTPCNYGGFIFLQTMEYCRIKISE